MYPPKSDAAQEMDSKPTPAIQAPVTGIPVSPPSHYSNQNPQYPRNHHHHHHQQQQGHQKVRWSSGLCDCCSDVANCCLTCWCPCITFGRIAEIVDEGTTSCAVSGAIYGVLMWFTCCSCLYSCLYRSKLRNQYMLHESPCNDCLVHCCCETCALCQEYRELKHRGFNMANGWQENMEGQNRGVAMGPSAPMVEQGMTR